MGCDDGVCFQASNVCAILVCNAGEWLETQWHSALLKLIQSDINASMDIIIKKNKIWTNPNKYMHTCHIYAYNLIVHSTTVFG